MPKKRSKKLSIHQQAWLLTILVVVALGFYISVASKQSPEPVQMISVRDNSLPLAFSHPSNWGQPILGADESRPDTFGVSQITFNGFSPELITNVRVNFRQYDADKYRYEEVCDLIDSVDLCSKMMQKDLLQEKNSFLTLLIPSKQSVAGVPATIEDFYGADAAVVVRKVRFYTPTQRVEISATYELVDFLSAHSGEDQNRALSEVAQEILGQETADPIHRLSALYPQELRGMTEFYSDFDAFVESIKINK